MIHVLETIGCSNMDSDKKSTYLGGSPTNWIGAPGSAAPHKWFNVSEGSRGYLWIKQNQVYLELDIYVSAYVYNNSRYPFAIYASSKPFTLTQYQGKQGLNDLGISGATWEDCYRVPIKYSALLPNTDFEDKHPGADYTTTTNPNGNNTKVSWEVHTQSISPLCLGDVSKFISGSSTNVAYVYLAGIVYYAGSSYSSSISTTAIQMEIVGSESWFDYYPGKIHTGSNWRSCNGPGGFTRMSLGLSWVDKKNVHDRSDMSTSLIHNGTIWDVAKLEN